ncbi:dienelactone hydrolase [Aspergillus cavernicola]|uniref:Dienelactone hydrolase n=1 Tax=Aspergillus cavernicola TaxID=176166 RepID=A0ABR4J1B3_9EURO
MSLQACCSSPAVGDPAIATQQETDFAADMSLCVVGDRSSKRGVVLVYDIFGLYPQTKEGAAILSRELNCLVIIPDFFAGNPANMDWVGMDTEDKRKNMMAFFQDRADPVKNLASLLRVMAQTKSLYPQVKSWGIVGLCWGGKLAAMASGSHSYFTVSGQAHPSLLDVADAKAISIPHICLPSPDEPAELLKSYEQAVHTDSEFELYSTMFHGWMGSRADLEAEQNAKEFQRGYKQVSVFFNKWL